MTTESPRNPTHHAPEGAKRIADPSADPVETLALRQEACCQSEPECILCPLRPENAHKSLRQLRDDGLYANLDRLGFKARPGPSG